MAIGDDRVGQLPRLRCLRAAVRTPGSGCVCQKPRDVFLRVWIDGLGVVGSTAHRIGHTVDRSGLVLLGAPQPVRIPAHLLRSWLDDPTVIARFESKRYRRADHLCWPWTAAVSSTGHGSFRAASRPGASRRGTIPAHLFAYQLEHGVIPRLGWSDTDDAVLCHQCDFAGCTNPAHMRLGTNTTNRAEYTARRRNLASPLSDVRGAAGRTRAIAAAIRTGLENQEDLTAIEARILDAEMAGLPFTLW